MASLLRLSAVLLAGLLLLPAADSAAQERKPLDRTVGYLQKAQHKDGGFGEPGSNARDSAWAALALAAAGINPRDQKQPGGTDVYTYLTRNTDGLTQSTDFARVILVATASGTSPERFGPINPLARLLKLQRRDGGFSQPPSSKASTINGTAYAVLAMAGTERSGLRRSQDRALDWLLGAQAADGSWDGTDLTGSVIEALNAGGRRKTPEQARAVEYLRSRQNPDGGFSTGTPGEESTTGSTAFIVRGLVAARLGATALVAAGSNKTPLDYLASMQQTDGSVRNSATDATNPASITAFTTPALAGASLPLPAVDREDPEDSTERRSEAPPAKTRGDDGTQPGAGGTADGGDGDVTAGGGGDGAPLFSQPKPGSRGVQPGGQRDTDRPSRATGQGEVAVAGESVAGKLVGKGKLAVAGKGRSLGSAPGLRAAAAGGQAPKGLVGGIGVALVLSALGGMYLERREHEGLDRVSTLTLIAALQDDLGDALARIASALRIPVLLAALLVLLASALELGRFATELLRRGLPGGRTPLAALAHRAEAEPANARELARKAPSKPSEAAVVDLARAASNGNDKVAAEHALADYELAVQRRLDRTRIIVRAGPAIGLMGTLIPLAPGLAALGRGDLPQLASDLRTAFAATVIGLLAGTVAFALTLTRTRIYSEDLTALERAAAAMGTAAPPPVPTPRQKKKERAEKERAEKEKEKEKAEAATPETSKSSDAPTSPDIPKPPEGRPESST